MFVDWMKTLSNHRKTNSRQSGLILLLRSRFDKFAYFFHMNLFNHPIQFSILFFFPKHTFIPQTRTKMDDASDWQNMQIKLYAVFLHVNERLKLRIEESDDRFSCARLFLLHIWWDHKLPFLCVCVCVSGIINSSIYIVERCKTTGVFHDFTICISMTLPLSPWTKWRKMQV